MILECCNMCTTNLVDNNLYACDHQNSFSYLEIDASDKENISISEN